jgi:hypothetical protein
MAIRRKGGTLVLMSYRTKRPRTRALLTFGVGATLAITQLGAGCVPTNASFQCSADASTDDAGRCVEAPLPDAGADGSDGGK